MQQQQQQTDLAESRLLDLWRRLTPQVKIDKPTRHLF